MNRSSGSPPGGAQKTSATAARHVSPSPTRVGVCAPSRARICGMRRLSSPLRPPRLSCRALGYILVTNDDGVESPALLPLVHQLRNLGEVRVAVPAKERSWIGKAISRWDELAVKSVVRDGIEILTVDGYPADCTNLAVHSLFE